jgi:hypothetical protein
MHCSVHCLRRRRVAVCLLRALLAACATAATAAAAATTAATAATSAALRSSAFTSDAHAGDKVAAARAKRALGRAEQRRPKRRTRQQSQVGTLCGHSEGKAQGRKPPLRRQIAVASVHSARVCVVLHQVQQVQTTLAKRGEI